MAPAASMAFLVSKEQDLTLQEALAYLQNEKGTMSSLPPVRPKGGDIYLSIALCSISLGVANGHTSDRPLKRNNCEVQRKW